MRFQRLMISYIIYQEAMFKILINVVRQFETCLKTALIIMSKRSKPPEEKN